MSSPINDNQLSFSAEDIVRAAAEGVIDKEDAGRLIAWGYKHRFEFGSATPPIIAAEQAKGLNIVTVAYYFGAMLMISACGWFLGDKWASLGSSGVLTTA